MKATPFSTVEEGPHAESPLVRPSLVDAGRPGPGSLDAPPKSDSVTIQRSKVVTQLIASGKNEHRIGDVRVHGRPPKTFGSWGSGFGESEGNHATAHTLHEAAVMGALSGRTLDEGFQRLDGLVHSIRDLPGYHLVKNLPKRQERLWKQARAQLLDVRARYAKRKAENTSSSAQDAADLEEYASAYVALREATPLSTIDVRKSHIKPGSGHGERAKPLLDHALGTQNLKGPEIWNNITGLLDSQAIALAAYDLTSDEKNAPMVARRVPGLTGDETPEQRLKMFADQHAVSVMTAFPTLRDSLAEHFGMDPGANHAAVVRRLSNAIEAHLSNEARAERQAMLSRLETLANNEAQKIKRRPEYLMRLSEMAQDNDVNKKRKSDQKLEEVHIKKKLRSTEGRKKNGGENHIPDISIEEISEMSFDDNEMDRWVANLKGHMRSKAMLEEQIASERELSLETGTRPTVPGGSETGPELGMMMEPRGTKRSPDADRVDDPEEELSFLETKKDRASRKKPRVKKKLQRPQRDMSPDSTPERDLSQAVAEEQEKLALDWQNEEQPRSSISSSPMAISVKLDASGRVVDVVTAGRPESKFSNTQGAHTTAWSVLVAQARAKYLNRHISEFDDAFEDKSDKEKKDNGNPSAKDENEPIVSEEKPVLKARVSDSFRAVSNLQELIHRELTDKNNEKGAAVDAAGTGGHGESANLAKLKLLNEDKEGLNKLKPLEVQDLINAMLDVRGYLEDLGAKSKKKKDKSLETLRSGIHRHYKIMNETMPDVVRHARLSRFASEDIDVKTADRIRSRIEEYYDGGEYGKKAKAKKTVKIKTKNKPDHSSTLASDWHLPGDLGDPAELKAALEARREKETKSPSKSRRDEKPGLLGRKSLFGVDPRIVDENEDDHGDLENQPQLLKDGVLTPLGRDAMVAAYLEDVQKPGTYMAEAEGHALATMLNLAVPVYTQAPRGWTTQDNIGGGDCLLHALYQVHRAVGGNGPDGVNPDRSLVAASPDWILAARQGVADQLRALHERERQTGDSSIDAYADRIVAGRIHGDPEPGLGPGVNRILNHPVIEQAAEEAFWANLKSMKERRATSKSPEPKKEVVRSIEEEKKEDTDMKEVVQINNDPPPVATYGTAQQVQANVALVRQGPHYVMAYRQAPMNDDPTTLPQRGTEGRSRAPILEDLLAQVRQLDSMRFDARDSPGDRDDEDRPWLRKTDKPENTK